MIDTKRDTMTTLPIPIPPQLIEAISYPGEARLVSLCWTSCGDTSWYDDGRSSGTGDAWSCLAWARHPAVAPHLAGWDLGSSDEEGSHRLLLDLQEGAVCVGTTAEVRAAVRGQWPEEEEVRLSPEQLEAVVEHVRRAWMSRPLPTAGELMASMRRHSALVAEMVRSLDERAAAREELP